LKSIDKHIGSDYYRIRIGVGRPEKKEDVVKYVLSDFTKDEFECINTLFPKIKKAIEDIKNAASKYSQKTC